MPETDYEYELNGPPRIDVSGHVRPPDSSGLGLDIDWVRVENDAFANYDCSGETA